MPFGILVGTSLSNSNINLGQLAHSNRLLSIRPASTLIQGHDNCDKEDVQKMISPLINFSYTRGPHIFLLFFIVKRKNVSGGQGKIYQRGMGKGKWSFFFFLLFHSYSHHLSLRPTTIPLKYLNHPYQPHTTIIITSSLYSNGYTTKAKKKHPPSSFTDNLRFEPQQRTLPS